MTLPCLDCQAPHPVAAANCAACGSVATAEIIAGVRRRHPSRNDVEAHADWVGRNAALVASGALCSECGGIWDMDEPPAGRPRRCLTCACGYGPASPAKKRRVARARKSVITANLEMLA